MKQILLAYGFPKETVTALIVLYKSTKAIVRSADENVEFF